MNCARTRARSESVWCACYLTCNGVGVPGWVGGGAELCDACEHARIEAELLARAGENPTPTTAPEEPARA